MSSSRESLYERMRRTSREEVILEEMIRLGFWPAQGQIPDDPADEIRRTHDLQRELGALKIKMRTLGNEAKLRKLLRKQLFEKAKQKRAETKQRHERERVERAERWAERKSGEILYLGAGVSAALGKSDCDCTRLDALGLPTLGDGAAIAAAMGISVGQLRFLAFARRTSRTTHYVTFAVPKKSGGVRVISAPMPRLRAAQDWILRNILDRVPVHDAAHGFRRGRSIVTNAQPHVGADAIVSLDLKDFFPSIEYRRIKGVFGALGYSEAAATIFALLCTSANTDTVDLDGTRYYVANGPRRLPQGAPTSPALSNILCRRLDRRLAALSAKLGFRYTRYADDLTFSASGDSLSNICNLLNGVRDIIAHEGLSVNEEKTRVVRRSRQQEVTGLVVNDCVAVPRQTLKRFRALLFQIEKDGPAGKHWGDGADVLSSIVGFANFVAMVDSDKGEPLRDRALALARKHGWTAPMRPAKASSDRPGQTPSKTPSTDPPQSGNKKWWKLW